MEGPERPVSVGVAALLTWISAVLAVGIALVLGVPDGAHAVPWATVGLLWSLAGALAVSAFGIGRQRRDLQPLAALTLAIVVTVSALTDAGPYALLNALALALVIVSRRHRGFAAQDRHRAAAAIRPAGSLRIQYWTLAAGRHLREYRIGNFNLRLPGDPDRRIR